MKASQEREAWEGGVRPFRASDWIGSVIACPHCGHLLKCTAADGPHLGADPSEGYRFDRYWILTLADGEKARMWEGRKGVVTQQAGIR